MKLLPSIWSTQTSWAHMHFLLFHSCTPAQSHLLHWEHFAFFHPKQERFRQTENIVLLHAAQETACQRSTCRKKASFNSHRRSLNRKGSVKLKTSTSCTLHRKQPVPGLDFQEKCLRSIEMIWVSLFQGSAFRSHFGPFWALRTGSCLDFQHLATRFEGLDF